MDLGFKGKVALITGAGSQIGFGKATALTLGREGCDVIINDINLADAQQTAAEVMALGVRSLTLQADVTKKADVDEMVEKGLAEFGKIDILVNNAGAMTEAIPFLEQKEEEWDKDINLNLKGAMFCVQAVLPGMMARKYGKIVNISSSLAKMNHPIVRAYTIAKSGLNAFTRNLATTVISSGITVNAVSPGWSLTNFIKGDKEAAKERLLPETPIDRGAEPQDIANTVAFLASDVSADIVGQVICVDGGSTMQ
ncbi:SDR family NAD(P)-dependent oxidoreductase [Thermodesulfobacteriota bacterium]